MTLRVTIKNVIPSIRTFSITTFSITGLVFLYIISVFQPVSQISPLCWVSLFWKSFCRVSRPHSVCLWLNIYRVKEWKSKILYFLVKSGFREEREEGRHLTRRMWWVKLKERKEKGENGSTNKRDRERFELNHSRKSTMKI